jgi:hypothetical protein
MSTKRELLTKFGHEDPFDGFIPDKEAKIWGWNGQETYLTCVWNIPNR